MKDQSWAVSKITKCMSRWLDSESFNVDTCCAVSCPSSHSHGLLGVPYNQLTEEENTWSWLAERSAWYSGTTWKWTAVALTVILYRGLWTRVGKRNLTIGWNFEWHGGWLLRLGWKMAKNKVSYPWACVTCRLDGAELEDKWRSLERRYMDGCLKVAQD